MDRKDVIARINANIQSLFKTLNISLEGHLEERLLWSINDSLSEPYKDIDGNQECWKSNWKCCPPLPCQEEFDCKNTKIPFEAIIKSLINLILDKVNHS